MSDAALFVLLGLGGGAVIAGIAMAVVITYRGSGIINLSTGAVSMVAAYGFWALRSGHFGPEFATVPALAITMAAAVLVGVLSELLVFRPLRTSSPLAKLVASLGILLVLQATMLLWFGEAPRQIPSVFPVRIVEVLGNSIPVNRFWMAGVVVLIALALGALFRWTRFGLATRAASENEVTAMLRGLSPNQLSMANTVLASAIAGAMGIVAAPLSQADSVTLVLFIVPALAAALFAGFSSLWIAAVAGFAIGIGQSLMTWVATLSWFPTDKGNPMPGVQALLTFVVLVIALSVRGGRLPSRGELVEKRLPFAPRPRRLAVPALALAAVGVVLLIVLPFSYRQALMVSMVGMVVCLSLVVITGFVGQVSLAQVTLAGVAGFAVSHMTAKAGIGFPWGPLVGSAAAVVIGLVVGVSALARARGEPGRGHAGRCRGDRAVRVRQPQVGRRQHRLAGRAARAVRHPARLQRRVPRARRQGAQLGARLRVPGRRGGPVPARGQSAPQRARPADAVGAGQRAGRRGRGHQRHQRQDRGVRDLVVHRRHGGVDVRLQLRLGQRRPVRHPDRPRVRRLRLHRRDHDGVGRRGRRARRHRGADPVHDRGGAQHLRQLDPLGRRA